MRSDHGPPHGWRPGGRGRSPLRLVFGFLALFIGLPLAAGVLLTAMFAGWTSVAVAVVFWLALFLVTVVAARVAFRNFRPVQELVTSTGRLADGDYTARVAPTESRAMAPLVDSFNQMAERLEISDDLRRRLLADVGHELRTPLTILRGEIEAMTDGVREMSTDGLRPLLDDLDAMERLLDDLRALSMTEAGMVRLEVEPTDVAELVSEVVGRFGPRAADEGVQLEGQSTAGTLALVDPDRVAQVLANLVINALRATEHGDRIDVVARSDADGDDGNGTVIIEISDTGRGIEPDRLATVFDRFHKSADSDGSGLGLTISRDLVVAHGGTIDLTSELGGGTTVTLRLPAAG